MTRSSEISFFWGGEERTFRLKIKQLEQLQTRCGERGPKRILMDLLSPDWKVSDIRETIRLGLYGAGMKLPEADKLIADYVDDRPLEENVLPAIAILQAVIVGGPAIRTGGGADPPQGERMTATKGSTSPSSTDREPSSDGHQQKSEN